VFAIAPVTDVHFETCDIRQVPAPDWQRLSCPRLSCAFEYISLLVLICFFTPLLLWDSHVRLCIRHQIFVMKSGIRWRRMREHRREKPTFLPDGLRKLPFSEIGISNL
jgi:hypothetical protein